MHIVTAILIEFEFIKYVYMNISKLLLMGLESILIDKMNDLYIHYFHMKLKFNVYISVLIITFRIILQYNHANIRNILIFLEHNA